MMNDFSRKKISIKMFFHSKAGFSYIPVFCGKGVIRLIDIKMPFTIFKFATFPVRIFFSRHISPIIGIIFTCLKSFNSFWHDILQFKKPAFSELTRIRCILRLLTGCFKHKKFAFSLAIFIITSLLFFASNSFSQGLDADTHLLMHNEADPFADASTTNNKGNASENADVDLDQVNYKWGAGSALYDGDSGELYYGDSADWEFCASTADSMTIDFQIKFTDHAGTEGLIKHDGGASDYYNFFHDHGNGWRFTCTSGGSQILTMGYAGEITDTNWHHIALIRVLDDYGIYVDGDQVDHIIDDTDTGFRTGNFYIGSLGGGFYFQGNIDEFRVQHSNYFNAAPNVNDTDSFTPPTAEYSAVAAAGAQLVFLGE